MYRIFASAITPFRNVQLFLGVESSAFFLVYFFFTLVPGVTVSVLVAVADVGTH